MKTLIQVSNLLASKTVAHVVVVATSKPKPTLELNENKNTSSNTASAIRWFLGVKTPKTLDVGSVVITRGKSGVVFATKSGGEMVVTPDKKSDDNYTISIKQNGKKIRITTTAFMDITDLLAKDSTKVLNYMAKRFAYWMPRLVESSEETKKKG